MNFLNGTKPMDNPLTQEVMELRKKLETLERTFEMEDIARAPDHEGICKIIRQCGESGVYQASFLDIELKLSPKKDVFEPAPKQEEDGLQGLHEQQYKVSQEDLMLQEQLIKQTQLEELELTNPAAYEELLLNGELTDAEETQDQ